MKGRLDMKLEIERDGYVIRQNDNNTIYMFDKKAFLHVSCEHEKDERGLIEAYKALKLLYGMYFGEE